MALTFQFLPLHLFRYWLVRLLIGKDCQIRWSGLSKADRLLYALLHWEFIALCSAVMSIMTGLIAQILHLRSLERASMSALIITGIVVISVLGTYLTLDWLFRRRGWIK